MSTTHGTEARWKITATVRQLRLTLTGPQQPLVDLETARHARDDLLAAIDLLAEAARREGATYGQIGRALGVTRQAARQAALVRTDHDDRRDEDRQWKMPLTQRRRRTVVKRSPARQTVAGSLSRGSAHDQGRRTA